MASSGHGKTGPAMTTTLNRMTARDLLAKLNARELSARELLDAHVARHEVLAKTINAIVATDLEHAYREAQAIDEARAKGKALGLLAGLPMTIKDGFDVERQIGRASCRERV